MYFRDYDQFTNQLVERVCLNSSIAWRTSLEETPVSHYANKLRMIRTAILAIDPELELSDPLMVITFLHGLGPNHGTFRNNLDASREERPINIDFEELIQEAIEKEAGQRKEDETDQRNGDFTAIRGPLNGKIIVEVDYCDHCRIPFHSTTNCSELHPGLRSEQTRKRRRDGREMTFDEMIGYRHAAV
ncbi:hypothetical protein KCU81_g6305, partial [Aureobasidium melanogenum]|uniref:Uncharacterized protein n=1 Tax=Aureobasidium melanogenum (strain CBS 110374) TaxID=1043003 RepID=A0A074VNL4_AURM1